MNKLKCTLLLGLLLVLGTACDRSVFFDEHKHLKEDWNMSEKIIFNVNVEQADLPHIYNFFVDLRNTHEYSYSNAFLFIKTSFPDGGFAQDTLECPLADPSGKWYGKKSGNHIDNRYYFRKNIVFPQAGMYQFEFIHGMRDTNVVGIEDIGLRIERIQ